MSVSSCIPVYSAGLSECFEVDGCWKKVAVCAGEVAREIK